MSELTLHQLLEYMKQLLFAHLAYDHHREMWECVYSSIPGVEETLRGDTPEDAIRAALHHNRTARQGRRD